MKFTEFIAIIALMIIVLLSNVYSCNALGKESRKNVNKITLIQRYSKFSSIRGLIARLIQKLTSDNYIEKITEVVS